MLAELGGPLKDLDQTRLMKVVVRFGTAGPGDRPEIDLSHRETAVLHLLAGGSSYKMIAHELAIGLETVRTYIKRIYKKLNVHNSAEAVAMALRGGLV
jgi:DNA-binding NarL/FixJ family response regulator